MVPETSLLMLLSEKKIVPFREGKIFFVCLLFEPQEEKVGFFPLMSTLSACGNNVCKEVFGFVLLLAGSQALECQD